MAKLTKLANFRQNFVKIAKIVMQIFIEPAWNAGERKKRTWHSCTAELPCKKNRLANDAKRNERDKIYDNG